MRRRARAGIALGLVVLVMHVASSCKEATAIRIEARTNAQASSVGSTTFTVRLPEEAEDGAPQAEARSVDATGFIGSLVAVPKGDDDASVVVKVVMGLGRPASQCTRADGYRDCIIARRRLSYVPGTTLALPIFLDVACRDIPCDALSTCSGGACVSSTISCSGRGCEGPAEPIDGGTSFVDAPIDPDAYTTSDGAFDAGDAGPDYTGVFSATKACPLRSVCCIDVPKPGICVNEVVTCPVPTGAVSLRLACDGPEDCRGGDRCCSTDTASDCKPACKVEEVELCHGRTDCTAKAASCLPSARFPTGYSECR